MGISKRLMFEEWEREDKRLEGKCHICEEQLRPDEKHLENECFSCIMERQKKD